MSESATAASIPDSLIPVSDQVDSPSTATVTESDLECALCCNVYYDPITTDECGHTFCRVCLHRSLEVKKNCPLCRSPCNLDALSHPTSSVLSHLVQRCFPRVHALRKAECAAELTKRVKAPRYGIFVGDQFVFPGAPIRMHIYEPKYRVLINRALTMANKQFIMMCVDQQRIEPEPGEIQAPDLNEEHKEDGAPGAAAAAAPAQPGPGHIMDPIRLHPLPFNPLFPPRPPMAIHEDDIGCLVTIKRCEIMPDGRSYVELVGTSRVHVRDVRDEGEAAFGLLSAEVRLINDETEVEPPIATPAEAATSDHIEPDVIIEEKKELDVDAGTTSEDGLRQRHFDGSSSSSSSSSSTSSGPTTIDPFPLPSSSLLPVRVPDLIRECRQLLTLYCQQSGQTIERLNWMNGGGSCPSDDQPAEFSWWLLRVLPDSAHLKHEAMRTTSLVVRLQLCVELLQNCIHDTTTRTSRQTKFASILVILAFLMIILKQYRVME